MIFACNFFCERQRNNSSVLLHSIAPRFSVMIFFSAIFSFYYIYVSIVRIENHKVSFNWNQSIALLKAVFFQISDVLPEDCFDQGYALIPVEAHFVIQLESKHSLAQSSLLSNL